MLDVTILSSVPLRIFIIPNSGVFLSNVRDIYQYTCIAFSSYHFINAGLYQPVFIIGDTDQKITQ